MLIQVTEFPNFYKKSKRDGFVWMMTFLTVCFLSIDIGLLVGVILSVLCIFCHSLEADISILGRIPDTDLFLDIERFEKAVEIPFVKIFHYTGGISFATKASFRNRLSERLGINLLKELKHFDKETEKPKGKNFITNVNFKHLVLDFSALSFIDPSSVVMLTALIKDFYKLHVDVSIVGCSSEIYDILLKNDFDFMSILFPTIPDAIYNR